MRQLMLFVFFAMSLACLFLGGCGRAPSKPTEAQPPEVIVCYPVVRQITDYNDFPGRFEAVKTVDIRTASAGIWKRCCSRKGWR